MKLPCIAALVFLASATPARAGVLAADMTPCVLMVGLEDAASVGAELKNSRMYDDDAGNYFLESPYRDELERGSTAGTTLGCSSDSA